MNKSEQGPNIIPNPDTGETPEQLRERAAQAQKRAAKRAAENRMSRQPGAPKKEEVDLSEALEKVNEAYGSHKDQQESGQ